MARIHGRYGEVSRTDVSPAVIVGSVSKWTLKQTRDYVEVTSFQDANKTYVVGLKDISGSISFFYNLDTGSPAAGDTEELFDMAESNDPVTIKLTPDTNNPLHYWTGPAYLDIDTIDVDVKGAVNGSATFKASGAWSRA
jgi:hypothetical protein